MRFRRIAGVLVTALAVFTAGCGPDSKGSTNGDGKRPLTVALPTEINSMDIYGHGDHVTLFAVNNMFNGLFKRNAKGEIVPDLAESYKKVDDTTWEFVLKKGVKFHTGDELTAEDVKFTLERAAKDKSLTENATFKTIKEVKVLSPHSLQIVTNAPDPLLLSILARTGAGIYPSKYIADKGMPYFLEHPAGTGPYRFLEWKKGSHIAFEPFDGYFEGPAKDWSKVTYRIIPESSTRTGELLTGGVDLIPNVTSNEWNRVKNNDKTTIVSSNSQRVAILVPNASGNRPTKDKRVREAIELAIDKKLIIEKLLGGEATETRTRVTEGNFGSNAKLFRTSLYDAERAKQLLKEAGYENGLELTMQSSNGRYAKDKEVAEMIVGMLANVGIKVKLELMEWNSYLELRNAKKVGDLHMVWLANSFYDAHILVSEMLTSSRSMSAVGLPNAELEELLKKASVNMNEEERKKQHERAQEIIAQEFMQIYVYLEKNTYGVSKSVQFSPRLDELIKAYEITKK
ncbi:ABC transporter substrate-binding protein [Paenibacillus flagellatus]|nr:ABC transporter substrate-binding protein [Paenibacillus flagellatus]